jgi:hypothetical protein
MMTGGATMKSPFLGRLALAAGLSTVPAVAAAVPVITGTSAARTSANTGATLRVYCDDCGYATDRVYFPPLSGANFVNPTAFSLNNWVDVRVPETWSGSIQLQKQGVGTMSNAWSHEISFSWSGQRWLVFPFTWVLNSAAAPGVGFTATRDALIDGYDAWECASGASITYGGSTAVANSTNDGVNCIYWSSSGWSPTTVAVTTTWFNIATGELVDANIAFNAQHFTWSATGAAGSMDVGNVGTHEEGHSIGLLDLYGVADEPETMFGFVDNGETQRRVLATDDELGAEFIYPHTRANLLNTTPGGWTAPVVPRTAAGGPSTLPPTLPGNANCYVNIAGLNNGGDCISAGQGRLDLDGVSRSGLVWGSAWDPGEVFAWADVPVVVRGGRHTLTHVLDATDETLESNELDNVGNYQYVWSPLPVGDQVSITRSAPPDPGTGLYDNCDGLSATGGWWGCVASLPQSSGDDYDVQIYDDYVGSTAGFQTPLASSFWGPGQSDFVLWNGNVVGNGEVRYVGVERFTATSATNVLVNASGVVGATLAPATGYGTSVSTPIVTITSGQVVKVHEVYLGSTSTTYSFTLDNLTGDADLNMSLYDTDGDYYGKSDYLRLGFTLGPGTDESFTFQPAATGYYAVVVWKRNTADAGVENTYQLRVGPALSNLTAEYVDTGDTGPNVARTTEWTGGPLTVSPTLPGEAGSHLYYKSRFEGPNPIADYDVALLLDEEQLYLAATPGPPSPLTTLWHLTPAWAAIPGGRHTLGQTVDALAAVAESDETDNASARQFVWDPAAALDRTPLLLARPPQPGTGVHANSNGRRYSRAPSFAWVSGLAATRPLDDYDLYVYDDYASSTLGFSNLRSASQVASNSTDFIVGAFDSSPNTFYPAVVRDAIDGGGMSYHLDHNNDTDRFGHSPFQIWEDQDLPAGRLVDVYSVYLESSEILDLFLRRETGTDNLAFAVFPPTPGGVFSRSEAIASSRVMDSARDTLQFSPSVGGWHPIVVYRTDGTQASTPLTYTFAWSPTQLVDAPRPDAPASLSFSGPFPNPARVGSRFVFALPQAGRTSLELYDVGGRKVATLADGEYGAGRHEVRLAERSLTPGVYWARLSTQGQVLTRRLALLAD